MSGKAVAVDCRPAQLHVVRVGSRRRYHRDSGVQISIAQTKCISKWNVESFQRNGQLDLPDIAVDANKGRATRFWIGRDQRIDVSGGELRSGLLVSARR